MFSELTETTKYIYPNFLIVFKSAFYNSLRNHFYTAILISLLEENCLPSKNFFSFWERMKSLGTKSVAQSSQYISRYSYIWTNVDLEINSKLQSKSMVNFCTLTPCFIKKKFTYRNEIWNFHFYSSITNKTNSFDKFGCKLVLWIPNFNNSSQNVAFVYKTS